MALQLGRHAAAGHADVAAPSRLLKSLLPLFSALYFPSVSV